MQNIYSFEVKKTDGEMLSLKEYEGKILLIFNSATHSPFTDFYYTLESIYRRYNSFGFEILDFPCNQFKGQTPESDKEINEFLDKTYKTSFLRLAKCEVTGENAIPLFQFLVKKKKFAGFDKDNALTPVLYDRLIKEGPEALNSPGIKENFTFFFIDREGNVKKRMEATIKKEQLEKYLSYLIDKA